MGVKVWAIGDLHLSFGVKNKGMEVFGLKWRDHFAKIAEHWKELIRAEDLVLLPGDLSWALHVEEALLDLEWVDKLPGKKVLIKGNHDLWWKSKSKIEKVLPSSLKILQNTAFTYEGVTVGGTRLWEDSSINYSSYIEVIDTSHLNVHVKPSTQEEKEHDERIFQAELQRLRMSLNELDPNARLRIAMLHYPPAGPNHERNIVTDILAEYKIDHCVYGHLHNLKPDAPVDFTIDGVHYTCTSCDWLNFKPVEIKM